MCPHENIPLVIDNLTRPGLILVKGAVVTVGPGMVFSPNSCADEVGGKVRMGSGGFGDEGVIIQES